jgi:hypothetical protein
MYPFGIQGKRKAEKTMKRYLLWIVMGIVTGACLLIAFRGFGVPDSRQPIYDMPIFTTIESIDRRLLPEG